MIDLSPQQRPVRDHGPLFAANVKPASLSSHGSPIRSAVPRVLSFLFQLKLAGRIAHGHNMDLPLVFQNFIDDDVVFHE